MDAGLAAVLGAAIGGGLTGLTAVGTGLFGLRTARLQLKSQESEAARQRRFDSLRERREPRSQAYAEFVAAGQDFVDILQGRDSDAFLSQYEVLQRNLRKRRATVAIAGPDAVVQAAGEFAREVQRARVELSHTAPGPLGVFRGRVVQRLDAFTKAARAALEDEGHQV
ncbi:hypothetical protein ACFV3E_05760 [Streptomyces sp. NPDC059718]